jgi:uncharacterized protein YlzI (FlbEa/FlbD family)
MFGLILLESVTTNQRRVRGKIVQNENTAQVWVNPEDISRVETEKGATTVTTRDGKRYRTREGTSSLVNRVNTSLRARGGRPDFSNVSSTLNALDNKVDVMMAHTGIPEDVDPTPDTVPGPVDPTPDTVPGPVDPTPDNNHEHHGP